MIGPVLRRMSFPQAVREALHLRADTFAFVAKPGAKQADIRSGRKLWSERGGVRPLAVVRLPDEKAEAAAAAASGMQVAVAAGAGVAVLELPAHTARDALRQPGVPAGRDTVTALTRHATVPILHVLTADDVNDPHFVSWLERTGCGWCLDPGRLFASGWWQPRQLTAVGAALRRANLPGAIWVREPEARVSEAGQAALGLGAMGLNVWWDVFAQPWTTGVPVYVEIPGRGATGAAELHTVRRLLEMARAG